ncbi:hypothetical protein BO71DRAFT_426490 [Aspergillus ellipticus CBS 707.79]|uniref:Uncharacterized protein n=1 Tax=Aspergillus ellipticus CBS 707.79 TaxID=1448320 RepID=A0A319DKU8_9EURO|nr:hypothetical protein BO71DRAFT_426490 [Aspergillus ellipticus CBS 707.79]
MEDALAETIPDPHFRVNTTEGMNTTASTTSSALVSWTAEPSGRGTLGLISTCLTTIFLCTWVVFALFFKAIIAPEFIAVEGLQEWARCRRMEVDMLALRHRTPRGDRVIWPNQYTWLLEQGLIDWADHASWGLSEEDIRDKSKSDSLAKLAALVQVSWFVAQCIIVRGGSGPSGWPGQSGMPVASSPA